MWPASFYHQQQYDGSHVLPIDAASTKTAEGMATLMIATGKEESGTPNGQLEKLIDMKEAFFFRGENPDRVTGGNCLVNWPTSTRLKKWGGGGGVSLDVR
jgi:hypothetical protein